MTHSAYGDADLLIHVDMWGMDWAQKRAGNPKSLTLSETIPGCIDNLATSPGGSGHDCFLKGCGVCIDWKINKIIREHLLRYNFINIVSSCSLMHMFEAYKEKGYFQEDVLSVDDIPLGFRYWISFVTNYLQLKTIYKQRMSHKRREWQEFCDLLETLPNSHWITGVEK